MTANARAESSRRRGRFERRRGFRRQRIGDQLLGDLGSEGEGVHASGGEIGEIVGGPNARHQQACMTARGHEHLLHLRQHRERVPPAVADATEVSPTVALKPASVPGFSSVVSVACSVESALLKVPNADTWEFSVVCCAVISFCCAAP